MVKFTNLELEGQTSNHCMWLAFLIHPLSKFQLGAYSGDKKKIHKLQKQQLQVILECYHFCWCLLNEIWKCYHRLSYLGFFRNFQFTGFLIYHSWNPINHWRKMFLQEEGASEQERKNQWFLYEKTYAIEYVMNDLPFCYKRKRKRISSLMVCLSWLQEKCCNVKIWKKNILFFISF